MEHERPQPAGGEPRVNSYGTDDPEKQARIEQARSEASEQRRRDRARLEQFVEQGMHPDDAEALIEFEHFVQEQHQHTAQAARATERAVAIAGEAETTPSYRPRIYVTDLASQRHGVQHGRWIDANQAADELDADIAAMLDSSPTPGARDWTVEATEGFAGLDLHGFTDTPLISRLAHGVAEHSAAYAVYVQIVGTDNRELLDKFEDFYVGSYDSAEAWARSVGDDMEWDAHLDRVVDPMVRPYLVIDYARFARDQRQAWDVLEGIDGKTHVFMR